MENCFVSWKLSGLDRMFDDKTRRSLWVYELNDEWNLICICEQNNRLKPSSIELHRKSLAGESIISGLLEIYTEGKQLLKKKKFICLLEDGCQFIRIYLEYPPDIAKSPVKASLVNVEVTINDRIEASIDLTELVHLTKTNYSSLEQLSSDMEKLLFEKPFLADVNLKCGPVTIPAQKSILSARSSVFEAMFKCPEELVNNVVIENVELPVLREMIEYMYTGKMKGVKKLSQAFDLVIAANKYQIRCLESFCNSFLKSKMSMKNVASILLIPDFVPPDLKNFAMDFVCNQRTSYSALEKTEHWVRLRNDKPDLALEVCGAIVKSQERKLKM